MRPGGLPDPSREVARTEKQSLFRDIWVLKTEVKINQKRIPKKMGKGEAGGSQRSSNGAQMESKT